MPGKLKGAVPRAREPLNKIGEKNQRKIPPSPAGPPAEAQRAQGERERAPRRGHRLRGSGSSTALLRSIKDRFGQEGGTGSPLLRLSRGSGVNKGKSPHPLRQHLAQAGILSETLAALPAPRGLVHPDGRRTSGQEPAGGERGEVKAKRYLRTPSP